MDFDWDEGKNPTHIETAISFIAVLLGVCLFGTGLFVGVRGSVDGPYQNVTPLAGTKTDMVIARVNGNAIRMSDVVMAQQDLPSEYRSLPTMDVFNAVLEQLIDRRLMSEEARRSGFEQRRDTRNQIKHYSDAVLSDAYLLNVIDQKATDHAVFQLYEERYLKAEATEEVHVAQILVRTEKEAQKVVRSLASGKIFADIARRQSVDSWAVHGGDMGYTTTERLHPEVADVLQGMAPGAVTDPFETSFGWHVVKLIDRRQKTPPRYKDVRQSLKRELVQIVVEDHLRRLRETSTIERFTPEAQGLDSTVIASQ